MVTRCGHLYCWACFYKYAAPGCRLSELVVWLACQHTEALRCAQVDADKAALQDLPSLQSRHR